MIINAEKKTYAPTTRNAIVRRVFSGLSPIREDCNIASLQNKFSNGKEDATPEAVGSNKNVITASVDFMNADIPIFLFNVGNSVLLFLRAPFTHFAFGFPASKVLIGVL